MFIPFSDPDFYPSRIPDPDPGSRIQQQQLKRRGKKFVDLPFCSHKYPKIENDCIFEQVKENLCANYSTVSQKIVTKLSKIWVWVPGSGIRDPGFGKKLFRIRDLGSRCQKGTGSRIRIRQAKKVRYCRSDMPAVD
jgi:hypothetical protein